ncbi:MAG: peptide deformylase [Candidatus Omnitrophota bacterium]
MATLKIYTYPDQVLLKKAKPIKSITEEDKNLISRMIETMYCAQGVGLAAPQVGISKKIIVITQDAQFVKEIIKGMDDQARKAVFAVGRSLNCQAITLINPEIKRKKGSVTTEEGCLSLPGINAVVKRAKTVWVDAWNIYEEELKLKADDLFARVLQHEIDHLNGVLFPQRVSILKRKALFNKFEKYKKQ